MMKKLVIWLMVLLFAKAAFGADALVSEQEADFSARFELASSPGRWQVKAEDTLQLPVRLHLLSSTLKEPATKMIEVRLLLNGELVAESSIAITVSSQTKDEVIETTALLAVPFDAPTGSYDVCLFGLAGRNGKATVFDLGKVAVEGWFATPKVQPVRFHRVKIEAPVDVQAGGEWSFKIVAEAAETVAEPPTKAVMWLELEPDLTYVAKSFDLPRVIDCRPKCKQKVFGPFTVQLPHDLPAGQYKIELGLVGEAYIGGKMTDLSVGTLAVNGHATQQSTTLKPLSYGIFVDCRQVPHMWYSTPAHTLIWNGEPFLPVSGMFNGPYMSWSRTPATFAKLQANVSSIHAHGLNHLYLYTQSSMEKIPAYAWQFLMDYLEEQGFSYVIGYPCGGGSFDLSYDARPIRARLDIALTVDEIKLPGKVCRTIKKSELGCTPKKVVSCLALAVDSTGRAFGPIEADLGTATESQIEVAADIAEVPSGKYLVTFLPQLHSNFKPANPWTHWRQQASHVVEYLSQIEFRPGLRGFVDMVLPNERGIYNESETLFFEIEEFLVDRASWLRDRYGTTQKLAKAWALSGSWPKDFTTCARLFPALSGAGPDNRLMLLVDPKQKQIFRADSLKSVFWYEYLEHRDKSYGKYQDKIIDMIRAQVDVPITIKRCGVTKRFHSNPARADSGIDGAGYEIYSAGDGLVSYGAGAGYAEMLQANKCMIGAATEFNRGFSDDMPANWPDLPSFFYDLSVAQHMCAKSTYLFLFDVLPYSYLTRVRLIEDSRMLEWMGIWNRLIKRHRDQVASHVPLVYTSWPPGDSWWAAPSERDAVVLTNDAPGTMAVKAANGVWVLPVFDPFSPAPVTIVTLADDPAVRYYAKEFEELLKRGDRKVIYLGLRRNLGALSIDRFFTPETFEITDDICQVLRPTYQSKILHRDEDGRVWALQEGNLQIVARRPKTHGVLDAVVKYITLPAVRQTSAVSAGSFLEKLMGVTSLSVAEGRFRGVAFQEDGQPVILLHSTSRKGGEVLELIVPEQRKVMSIVPAESGKTVCATGPTRLTLRFLDGPGDNWRKGAGAGVVTIIGLRPEELQFAGQEETRICPALITTAVETNPLPMGLELPPIKLPVSPTYKFIDPVKAVAALKQAVVFYNQGQIHEAERIGKEWINLSPKEFLPGFYLLLGNVRLLQRDAQTATDFYRQGLKARPEDSALRCGLGVSLAAVGDLRGSEFAFEQAIRGGGSAVAIARKNLSIVRSK